MLHVIEAEIFVELAEGQDPEDITVFFASGFEAAISTFPDAEVVGTDVRRIRLATPSERERFEQF